MSNDRPINADRLMLAALAYRAASEAMSLVEEPLLARFGKQFFCELTVEEKAIDCPEIQAYEVALSISSKAFRDLMNAVHGR